MPQLIVLALGLALSTLSIAAPFQPAGCSVSRLEQTGEQTIYRPSSAPDVPAGWIEQEFVIGCDSTGANEGTSWRTTFNLLRPASDALFSGVVIVEATHPGNLWPVRSTTADYMAAKGHASITVNSSNVVVERLVQPANPSRYADLSIPDESLESPVLRTVARLVRRGATGLSVDAIVLAGFSNTAARVRSYIDWRQANGSIAYDGFLVGQTSVGTMAGPLPDLDVPVIQLEGERELIATLDRNPDGLAWRRDDGPSFRLYEVPGMAHLDTSDPERLLFPPAVCGIETVSSFPLDHVWGATLELLIAWVVDGAPAPSAARIAFDDDGRTIARDEDGNARGGVPLPQMTVPAATILTVSRDNPDYPRARCDMIGPEIPFARAMLASRYGSEAAYLAAFEAALDRAIRQGWYLPMFRNDALARARTYWSSGQD